MPDEINASTEPGTPTDSVTSGDATSSATGQATGTEGQSTAAGVTTPAPVDDGIDIGWSFEDAPAEVPAIPDNDDDIQELLKDPQLDPARTPGLVEALRNARKDSREARQQFNQFRNERQQLEQAFEQFGGFDGARQTLDLVTNLFNAPQEATVPFLQNLFEQAYPTYQSVFDNVIEADPNYAIQRLQALGALPADLTEQRTGTLDQETLNSIPEHLRDVAKSLPAEYLEDLLLQPDTIRNFNLEREAKLREMDATQRQQAEASWNHQLQQAQTQGRNAVDALTDQYEKKHYSELGKWAPFGPDQSDLNQDLHRDIVEGAFSKLLEDQKFSQMFDDINRMMREAPLRRLHKEALAADQDERKARQLAMQFNARLGQLISTRVKAYNRVFENDRKWREYERSTAPTRTEIPGQSTQAGSNGRVRTLNERGEISDEYTAQLTRDIRARLSQGG